MRRRLSGVLLFLLLTLLVIPQAAEASFTDCPANTSPGDPLTMNLTEDECTLETGAAGSALSDDLIQIQIVSGSSTNFFIFDPSANDTRDLVFNVNNGSDVGTLDADGGSLTGINCAAGCTVSGTHGGTPFSFVYTASGGGGSLDGAPEIDDLSSSTGNNVADGGTDTIATAINSGTATTITYDVSNSGSETLTLSGLTLGTPTNASFGSTSIDTASVASGGTETDAISITFTPSSTTDGAGFSVPFSFTTNDADDGTDETTFNVTISGMITAEAEISDLTSSTTNTVSDGGSDAQGTVASGSAQTLTYTITNTGTADLTVATATSSSLNNVTVNSVGAPGSTSVAAAGGTTQFNVQYTPTAAGAFSFGLSFVNSDADEDPFNFTVSGTATQAPGFSQVIAPGTILADGTATVTFTIDNSANATAATALDFTNTLPAGVEVAATPNGSTTCTGGTLTASGGGSTISYTGGTVSAGAALGAGGCVRGDRRQLQQHQRRSDLKPGQFRHLSASLTVASPEIDLQRPAATSLADGSTDAQGSVAVGVQQVLTYTVENTGNATLTLSGTPSSAAASNVSVDSISAPGTSSLASSASTTFTVAYTPTAAGAFSFELDVDSDDADEGTYDLTISGTATQALVQPGDRAGDDPADGTATVTFTIDNSANATAATALDFSNSCPRGGGGDAQCSTTCTGGTLTASGSGAAQSYTGGTVSAGASCTVQADVTAATDGSYSNTSGDLTSSLGNSGTSSASLTVASPEIDLQRPAATSLADGGTDAQGSVAVGVQQVLTYTVENTGTATLTLSGTPASAAASNVSVDSISAPGTSSLAASASTTFTVAYTPTAAGAFSFELDVDSDDADEGTYDLTISGTATGSAEIGVGSSSGGTLEDGDTDTIPGTPSAGSANVITYTFTNSGSDTLNITTPTVAGNISHETNVVVNGLTLASNTVASGGGTTTLEISYTPQASGAYSFDLQVANTDADESLFNITVAGAASGTPEIEVSSSASGALSDGGTDSIAGVITPGTATSVTYTITNSGTDVLSLDMPSVASSISNQNNVTVDSLSLAATSVASGGGTTTLQVDYTAIAGGAYGFNLSLGSDDADEDPFDISVTGTAQSVASGLSIQSGSGQVAEVGAPFAAPLVALVTDSGGAGVAGVDVTFTAPASGASVVFASTGTRTETVTTGADGTATSSAMTANDAASSYAGGSTLTSYDVSASATGLSSVNFALTNDRDAEADIQKTQEVIAAFVSNRANIIVSNQPDLVSRLTQGGLARQQGRNGFGLRATSNRRSATFRFSLRALLEEARRRNDGSRWRESLRTAEAGAEAAAEDAIAARVPALRFSAAEPAGSETTEVPVFAPVIASGWDFWAEGTYAVTENGNFESRSGLFFAGVDYRWSDKVVLGVMGQLDITDEDNSVAGTSASGTGWMAGPYVVVRLDKNLYLDVAATYGQSSNTVNALGLFEDDFNTERFLLQGGLTGDFKLDARTTISPFARLIYYYEKQESYTDTLGRVIPSQEFDLGRFEFGPRVSWQLALDGNTQLSPYLSFSGIYDFNKLQGANPTDATLASSQSDFRGRLEAGATFIVPDRGIKIAFEGFYDGIGASDFESYGASLNIHIPF